MATLFIHNCILKTQKEPNIQNHILILRTGFQPLCIPQLRKYLKMFENKDAHNIIKSAIEMIDPNFDHPFAWHNFGEEHLQRAKQLWNFT